MAIRYKVNCKVCISSKQMPEMRKMIYNAKFHPEPGDYSLKEIQYLHNLNKPAEEKFSLSSLSNHVNKHITRNAPTAPTRAQNIDLKAKQGRIDSLAEQMGIDSEAAAEIGEIVSVVPVGDAELALDAIIDQGVARIKSGELKVNVSNIVQAAKIKVESKNKQKDQQLELTKMVYRFASGEKKEIDATTETSGSTDTGSGQPGDIHNEVTRDAVTRWAAQVPAEYAEATD